MSTPPGSDDILTIVCLQITLTGWAVRRLCQEDERETWQKVTVSNMMMLLRCVARSVKQQCANLQVGALAGAAEAMYVCVCVCTHTHTHTYIYSFKTYVHVCAVCVCMCVFKCVCIYISSTALTTNALNLLYHSTQPTQPTKYIYIHIYMFVCIYIYVYIHTHTHTHTHCGRSSRGWIAKR
jgi:hypothetical protein